MATLYQAAGQEAVLRFFLVAMNSVSTPARSVHLRHLQLVVEVADRAQAPFTTAVTSCARQ